MNSIFKYCIYTLLSLVVFSSCEGDFPGTGEIDTEISTELNAILQRLLEADQLQDADLAFDILIIDGDTEMETTRGEASIGQRLRFHGECFSVNFPLMLSFPDNSTSQVEDANAARQTIATWIQANQDSIELGSRIALVYPVTVQLPGGGELTITERSGFRTVVMGCGRGSDAIASGGRRDSCFSYVFPVNFSISGEVVQGENAVQVEHLLYSDEHEIDFPFNVVFPDETVDEISDEDSFYDLYERCEDGEGGGVVAPEAECFVFVYPLNYIDASGQQVQVFNEEEHEDLLEDGAAEIQYPFEILILDDESTEIISDENEFEELLEECEEDAYKCFSFVFPLNLSFDGVDWFEVYSDEELEDAIIEAEGDVEVEYPFDVVLADGTLVSMDNQEMFTELAIECDWGVGVSVSSGSIIECLDYIYPINYLDVNGDLITINNQEEHYQIEADVNGGIQFPFEIRGEGDIIIEVEDEEMYSQLLEDCD